MNRTFFSKSPQETEIFGRKLASLFQERDIIAFQGELGAGKTAMIKGIALGLGIEENITSSSFVLMRPFLSNRGNVYHFDLYRLCSKEELLDIGYDEYLFSDAISLIEWAEKLGSWIGEAYLQIRIEYDENQPQHRTITLSAHGKRFESLLEELNEIL